MFPNIFYLRYAHGVLATRVRVARVGHDAALGRGGVGHETLGALAGGLALLGDAHGARPAGVRVTGVPARRGGRGRVRGQGRGRGLARAGVGTACRGEEWKHGRCVQY